MAESNKYCSKYNFGTKKRKLAEDNDDRQLEESVRTISALFNQAGNEMAPASTETDEPLEARVASISAEIAAAIAQAQSREYEDDEDGSGSASGSGRDVPESETVGPNTSGIRGGENSRTLTSSRLRSATEDAEDDDSDTFPIPLRTRKTGKDGRVVVGKRKR
jgi:hypothetical protein